MGNPSSGRSINRTTTSTEATRPAHVAATLETMGNAGERWVACRNTATDATTAHANRTMSMTANDCQAFQSMAATSRDCGMPYQGRNSATTSETAAAVSSHSAGRRRRRSMCPLRARGRRGYALGLRGGERVAQQAGDRHRSHAARHGRDEGGALTGGLEVDVASDAVL